MTLASTPRQYSTQSGGTLRASTLPRAGTMVTADETRAPWRSLRAVGIILSYSQTGDVGEIKALYYIGSDCIRREQMLTPSGSFPVGSQASAALGASENGGYVEYAQRGKSRSGAPPG